MANRIGDRARLGLLCGLALVALAGCQENTAPYSPPTASTTIPKPVVDLGARSGVPVPQSAAIEAPTLAASRSLGSRPNPFALTGEEIAFNQSQWTENILSRTSYTLEVVPTLDDPEAQPPIIEPVPNWRLSGVLVGASGVVAILDTGGRTYEIVPGTTIPGTPWRVVSIDSDRALLARDGNRLPREFYVSLSGPITGPGVTVAGGNQGAGNMGGPGGTPGQAR